MASDGLPASNPVPPEEVPKGASASVPIDATAPVPEPEWPGDLRTLPYGGDDNFAYQTDYGLDQKLEAADGSDVALYDLTFSGGWSHSMNHESLSLTRKWGQEFDSEKEDIWLFDLHLNSSQVEIAIGGETNPVLATSYGSFREFDKDARETDTNFLPLWKTPGAKYPDCKAWSNLSWNCYLTVRCPKTTNPAITIKGKGQYAAIRSVGLFIKNCVDNKNQFVTIRTTNRLLMKYGERNRNAKWWSLDGGADITGQALMLYPKQLFGADNSMKLYREFVTTDPNNEVAEAHLALIHAKAKRNECAPCTKYGWNQEDKTYIDLYEPIYVSANLPPVRYSWCRRYDYVTGQNVEIKQQNSLNVLLTVFGSVAKVATGIASGNYAAALTGILDFPEKLADAQKRDANANDVKGFITTLAELSDSMYKNHKDKKARESAKVNKDSVKDILDNLKKFLDDPSTFGKN